MDVELTKADLQGHQALFAFDNINFQFLLCGSSGVSLCSQRFLVLAALNDEIISFRISEESSIIAITSGPLFKCRSEVGGIRIYSKDYFN